MKPWSLPQLQSLNSFEDLKRFTTQALTNILQALTRQIGFMDNIDCQIVEVNIGTFSDTAIPHNLNRIPIGFIVLGQDQFSNVKNGSTAWTKENIYLVADVTTNFKIAIIGS